jgi:hypothetical protein
MAQSLSEARARAITDIQILRDRRNVNSLEYATADHAIDLVLNASRPEDAFLVVNALKDARSVMLRRRRRENDRTVELSVLDNLSGEGAASPSAGLCRSPEATLVESDAYDRLKAWGDAQPVRTARCLEEWRLGFTGQESAKRNGLSRRTINTQRRTIRDAARSLLSEAA